jgi:hypothetical protein
MNTGKQLKELPKTKLPISALPVGIILRWEHGKPTAN